VTDDGTYAYCKIFVNHDEPSVVSTRLAALLGATVQRRSLLLPGIVLDVRANPDVDPAAGTDFVRWPVIVEVEPEDSDTGGMMTQTVSRILTDLWNAEIPAVAACDFEHELPWNGGIGRLGA
jgi:hypothetical protein